MNFAASVFGRSFRGALVSAFAALATLTTTGVQAQNPPPGALFDLSVVHPTPLPDYTLFSFSFIAGTANTVVSFAFREVPAFFAFDDVSVSLQGGGANLLANPGFEDAVVGQNTPTAWGRFIQPIAVSAIGQVASSVDPYGCSVAAHTGTNFWCDGAVEGYDGLFQTVSTAIGSTYNVSFWLQDNSGRGMTNPTINMLGYAAAGLPGGTVPVALIPEPETYALLLAGLAAMGVVARRRKAKGRQ